MGFDNGLLTGELVPADAIEALGIQGKRTALVFFCRDDGFEDGKELRDFQERATSYSERSCSIVAVRSDAREAVKPDTDAKYPDIRLVVDAGDVLRRQLRMKTGGPRGGERHTYLVDEGGRVQGQVNNFPDAFVHSQMCLRALKAMDDPVSPWDAKSEKVDKEAAKRQEMYDIEMKQIIAQEMLAAEKIAAAEAAEADRAEGAAEKPAPAAAGPDRSKFFEGFFGAFQKKE